MTDLALHLVVPGALDQRTGGYLYDARIVRGLRALGWEVFVHELDGTFPDPDVEAEEAMRSALQSVPDGATVVLDGLAMGALPGPLGSEADRLRLVSLVHHPLAEETGLPPELRRRFQASERAALEGCVGVIVTSPFTAGAVSGLGVPEARIAVVPPGTDRLPLATGPQPGCPPALLCVGTVTPRKGHDVLVEALERTSDLAWSCTCVGSTDRAPDFVRDVRARICAAGLDGRIVLAGEQPDAELAARYREASAFILASRYEGYGMALAEAIASGLPIVSTTGGAIPDTVPPEAAVLVPTGDPEALAQALRTLLTDDALRERLTHAARRHREALPGWDDAALIFAEAVVELTA